MTLPKQIALQLSESRCVKTSNVLTEEAGYVIEKKKNGE